MALKVGELYASLNLDSSRFSSGLQGAKNRLESMQQSMYRFGKRGTMMVSLPLLGAGTAMTRTVMGFEKSMSKVEALTGATGEELQQLKDVAREMGATTSKSATEAADALGYMALAGWDTQTSMDSLEPILRLSEAAGMDLARASDLVTDSMSSLSLESDELMTYLDGVTATMANANTDANQLMEALIGVGGTAANLNIPLHEMNAMLGILANRGLKGSEAGNSLNAIMMALTTGLGRAGEAMEELNLSAFDAEGNFKGMEEVLKELKDATSDMSEEQRNYYLAMIGGRTQIDTLTKLLAGLDDEYDELTEKIKDSDGALMDMAATMRDNLSGDWAEFKSAVEELALSFKDQLLPFLRDLLELATKLARKLGDLSEAQKLWVLRISAFLIVVFPLITFLSLLLKPIIGLLTAIGKLITKFYAIKGAAKAAKGGMAAAKGTAVIAISPFWKLAAAVGAVAGAVYLMNRRFNEMDYEEQLQHMDNRSSGWTVGHRGEGRTLASRYEDFDPQASQRPERENMHTARESEILGGSSSVSPIKTPATDLLRSYAAGTSFVPKDMIAKIHRGEAIVPASINPFKKQNEFAAAGGFGGQSTTIRHEGSIRIEGYNSQGEFDRIVDVVVNDIRRGLRT